MVLLQTGSPDPQRYERLLEDGRWWMPALLHLAIELDALSPVAREALQNWADRRERCFYIVVQEETDDHLSLTASSWPLVDDRGRLRFPISVDPVEFHAERGEWQSFVDSHRAHWLELGVLTAELAARPIQLGDTFALRFDNRRSGAAIDLLSDRLDRPGTPTELHLQPPKQITGDGIPVMDLVAHPVPSRKGRRRSTVATTAGWLTDITWDARQAGKVAQLAAFAGVLNAERDTAQRGDDQRIDEGVDRQFRAFVAGVDPDETIALDDNSPEPAREN